MVWNPKQPPAPPSPPAAPLGTIPGAPFKGLVAEDVTISVAVTSTLILGANAARVDVVFVNDGAADIYIRKGAVATLNTGGLVAPGGTFYINALHPWYGEVYGIANGAASVFVGTEVSGKP